MVVMDVALIVIRSRFNGAAVGDCCTAKTAPLIKTMT